MASKKLISFTDDKYKKTFTESVRILIDNALKQLNQPEQVDSDGVFERVAALEEEVKKLSWWTCDDNTSRMGNIEVELKNMQKSINVLTAASKLFKGHLKDRSIHLQD
jgi:uncharacterized protein HemX